MDKLGKNIAVEEFENLYFEHYSHLCIATFRFVKDMDITKDIVQDVFLKYWKKINELHIHESPKSYLHRACINQALNYLKEKARRTGRENKYVEDTQRSSSYSDRPDRQYEFDQTSANIQTVIDQLPNATRNVFLLSRFEYKSYKEIATILDISVNTVEKHIGKALQILREKIKF